MDNCSAHSETIRRLDDFQKWSDDRDREQETAIAGVSRRMDELHDDVQQLKTDVAQMRDTMPETITDNISRYIDVVIANAVKEFFRWFIRAIIGGGIVTIATVIIRGMMQ